MCSIVCWMCWNPITVTYFNIAFLGHVKMFSFIFLKGVLRILLTNRAACDLKLENVGRSTRPQRVDLSGSHIAILSSLGMACSYWYLSTASHPMAKQRKIRKWHGAIILFVSLVPWASQYLPCHRVTITAMVEKHLGYWSAIALEREIVH